MDTLREYLLSLIETNDKRYVERHDASQRLIAANDLRYQQRFDEQQAALGKELRAREEATTAAIAAQDRAVIKAEAASEKRFESVNEFRATLQDQQRTLMPRSEVEAVMKAQNEKIAAIGSELAERRALGTGVHNGWGYAAGVVGVVLAVVTIVMYLAGKH